MERKTKYSDCPVVRSMAILGSKWKPVVIYALRDRTARFGQIVAIIGVISRKVLSSTLKELEGDGIVSRMEYREGPQRVEYSLTEKGMALVPLIVELSKWDEKYN